MRHDLRCLFLLDLTDRVQCQVDHRIDSDHPVQVNNSLLAQLLGAPDCLLHVRLAPPGLADDDMGSGREVQALAARASGDEQHGFVVRTLKLLTAIVALFVRNDCAVESDGGNAMLHTPRIQDERSVEHIQLFDELGKDYDLSGIVRCDALHNRDDMFDARRAHTVES